jgi:ubiquinone/menaquinone biosynthesis C-methylase UbiE
MGLVGQVKEVEQAAFAAEVENMWSLHKPFIRGLVGTAACVSSLAALCRLNVDLGVPTTVMKPFSMWERLASPQRLLVHGGPDHILDRVPITQGSRIIELGPRHGFFTFEAARRVGNEGRLYSVEVDAGFADRLGRKIKAEHLSNVEIIESDAATMPLKDEAVDGAILIMFLGEMSDPGSILDEVHRVLKPKGFLSISESLPNPEYPLRKTVKNWCELSGFMPVEQLGNFFCYTLNFRKAPEWWWVR